LITDEQIEAILTERISLEISFWPGVSLHLKREPHGRYLQCRHERSDANTGEFGVGWGGKWFLPDEITVSDVVKVARRALVALAEHEIAEGFYYCGERVFDPHVNIEALWLVAKDKREGQDGR
jgi:hypothetical protein